MTKRAEAPRGPGRPTLAPEERRRKVLLSLSGEVDLALSVLAEARGTSRSGVVEQLVRETFQKASPRRRRLAP